MIKLNKLKKQLADIYGKIAFGLFALGGFGIYGWFFFGVPRMYLDERQLELDNYLIMGLIAIFAVGILLLKIQSVVESGKKR